jgi:hypothetical protein
VTIGVLFLFGGVAVYVWQQNRKGKATFNVLESGDACQYADFNAFELGNPLAVDTSAILQVSETVLQEMAMFEAGLFESKIRIRYACVHLGGLQCLKRLYLKVK